MITSLENDKIKNLVKLQQKKYRDLTNTYIVEGEHLVKEAYNEGLIKEIYALDSVVEEYDCNYIFITPEIMKKISTMDTPSNIIALCNKRDYQEIIGNKILLLDDIQDPGNLGTIIRSAVAFNIDMIILSNDSVDLYNPKVLRSTQGMYTHIPVIRMDLKEAISKVKEKGIKVYGTNVVNGTDVRNVKVSEYALVMGNEGNGVRKEIEDLCDENLYIPMNKQVESLNVAIACSILLYELGD